jgi:hypothetical protein
MSKVDEFPGPEVCAFDGSGRVRDLAAGAAVIPLRAAVQSPTAS